MKLASLFLALFLVLIGIQSCQKDTTEVTYTSDVKTVMNFYCTTCHSGSNPSAGLNLNNYQNVREQTENGTLLQRINDPNNPMPTSGLMPENERNLINDWVAGGYQ